jgi:hypothetical protein
MNKRDFALGKPVCQQIVIQLDGWLLPINRSFGP